MTDPLHEERLFAVELAIECSEVALRYQSAGRSALNLRHKPGGEGPVTAADHHLNEKITAAIERRFAGDRVVAEEGAFDRRPRQAQRVWIVDPIDGTAAFSQGRPDWSIMIGLTIDGQPALGVVAEPSAYRLYWATRRAGCAQSTRPGQDARAVPLRTAQADPKRLHWIGGPSMRFSKRGRLRRSLLGGSGRETIARSVGVRMAAIARGAADVHAELPGRAKVWDTCAAEIVVTAAGGRVTDLRGQPLVYGAALDHRYGVLTSYGRDHEALVRKIAPLVERWLDES